MFENQPKGLYALALANTGERFGYYTMLAIFALFMQAKFGWTESEAGQVYAIFLAVVYFAPLLGGMLADKIGYGKCVTLGFATMFLGYLGLAIPTGADEMGKIAMFAGLACVSLGTGLFKGNLQVLVGNLYDSPQYASSRDSAFSLFYMAINLGSMFAPSMAKWITNLYLGQYGFVYDAANQDPAYLKALYGAYGLCFGVACISLIFSAVVYFAFRGWFKHADITAKQAKESKQEVEELTPKQTRDRIVALLLVFGVVIFFWMAFHQNGSALTFFAKKYTNLSVSGSMRIWFNIFSLALIALSVYTGIGVFQSKTGKNKVLCGVVTLLAWAGAIALFMNMEDPTMSQPSDFQQFNPFFVVALTPFSMLFFGYLAKKGHEVSAPARIALGMFVAAVGFAVITLASTNLISPMDLGDKTQSILSPSWLISTYFTLTLAELLLSPMGISFVSKVAPPKYKGLMMGGWFVATAIGNYLSSIPSMLWNRIPLMYNWGILIALCLVSALVMFALLKKLNKMTA
ncbi:peptide MFS transporter [uncultured Alloprevotella sp.]|uniref:peptide MFS transporter n=1 Tax=uncultured Alloprevotella sp. TaxID=1283315 RepID=UPI00325FAD53